MLYSTIVITASFLSFTVVAEARRRRNLSGSDTQGIELSTSPDDQETEGLVRVSRSTASSPASSGSSAAFATASLLVIVVSLLGVVYAWQHFSGRAAAAAAAFEPWCTEPADLVGAYGHLSDYSLQVYINPPSERAQRLFSQGLVQFYGFDQVEALRNFRAAVEEAPGCAMCQWGVAAALGPFINVLPVPASRTHDEDAIKYPAFKSHNRQEALDAATSALRLAEAAAAGPALEGSAAWGGAGSARELEVGLCAALVLRYNGTSPEADRRYAAALGRLHALHRPPPPDLTALRAEALMLLNSWAYYEAVPAREEGPGGGLPTPLPRFASEPKVETAEALDLLQSVLEASPLHPLALHLTVHATEPAAPVSSFALREAAAAAAGGGTALQERGVAAAEALPVAAPAQGHLVHMAGHAFIRAGRYADAAAVNVRAFEVDTAYAAACLDPYATEHNLDMLVYGASMAGQRRLALRYAARIPSLPALTPTFHRYKAEHSARFFVHVRYADWAALAALEAPPAGARYPAYNRAVWQWARVFVAAAAAAGAAGTGREAAAAAAMEAEAEAFKEAALAVPPDGASEPGDLYTPHHRSICAILGHQVAARVAQVQGRLPTAVEELARAAAVEEGMPYAEPPRLHQPTRQCLARVLLLQSRLAEAAQEYEADLLHYPDNGWSLQGLVEVQRHVEGAGAGARLAELERRLEAAWIDADHTTSDALPPASSCPAFDPPAPVARD